MWYECPAPLGASQAKTGCERILWPVARLGATADGPEAAAFVMGSLIHDMTGERYVEAVWIGLSTQPHFAAGEYSVEKNYTFRQD